MKLSEPVSGYRINLKGSEVQTTSHPGRFSTLRWTRTKCILNMQVKAVPHTLSIPIIWVRFDKVLWTILKLQSPKLPLKIKIPRSTLLQLPVKWRNGKSNHDRLQCTHSCAKQINQLQWPDLTSSHILRQALYENAHPCLSQSHHGTFPPENLIKRQVDNGSRETAHL